MLSPWPFVRRLGGVLFSPFRSPCSDAAPMLLRCCSEVAPRLLRGCSNPGLEKR